MPFYVTIDGASKKHEEIEQYVYDILSHFYKKEPARDVDINITFERELDANAFGYCWGDKSSVEIQIGRGGTWPHLETGENKFCYYGFDAQLKTLSHELVHAKQFLRGEITGHDRTWRKGGQVIDCSHIKEDRELPWEQEAYALEDSLYETYWRK